MATSSFDVYNRNPQIKFKWTYSSSLFHSVSKTSNSQFSSLQKESTMTTSSRSNIIPATPNPIISDFPVPVPLQPPRRSKHSNNHALATIPRRSKSAACSPHRPKQSSIEARRTQCPSKPIPDHNSPDRIPASPRDVIKRHGYHVKRPREIGAEKKPQKTKIRPKKKEKRQIAVKREK